MLSAVKKGTLISSISGTGQVSASNQVDIKSKVSGDALFIGVLNGQEVKAGTLIAQVDARDALINLESAKISLEKLIKPADAVSLLQTENALEDAKLSKKQNEDNLVKSYDDGFNTVANGFLDMPDIMTGLNDLLNASNGYLNDGNVRSFGDTARDYRNKASESYFDAKAKYDANLIHYKNLSRTSATTSIESLIAETYETVKTTAEAIKNSKNTIDYMRSIQTANSRGDSATAQSNLNSWTSKTNTHLLNLLSIKNSIANLKDALLSSSRDIAQKTESLIKLKTGADPLDIRSQELSLRQKEYAYQDYFIRVPFDGTIAKLNVKKTDAVSGGTIVATLITKQKTAEISLNEIDAAKIKIGQKANLTFDAIDGLSITGKVTDMDLVGTVTQGVVTYTIKISFDTQDDRIRPGMSVSAAIITDVAQDTLIVTSSAIKSQNGDSYVEVFDRAVPQSEGAQGITSPIPPRQQPVGIGISNDTSIEIISGLKEGDLIVTRTITTQAKPASTAPSLFGTGGRNTGGSNVRIPR